MKDDGTSEVVKQVIRTNGRVFARLEHGSELRRARPRLMIPPLGFEQHHLLLGAEEPPIEAREDPRSEVEPCQARERDVPAHLEVQGLVVHQRGAAKSLQAMVARVRCSSAQRDRGSESSGDVQRGRAQSR